MTDAYKIQMLDIARKAGRYAQALIRRNRIHGIIPMLRHLQGFSHPLAEAMAYYSMCQLMLGCRSYQVKRVSYLLDEHCFLNSSPQGLQKFGHLLWHQAWMYDRFGYNGVHRTRANSFPASN